MGGQGGRVGWGRGVCQVAWEGGQTLLLRPPTLDSAATAPSVSLPAAAQSRLGRLRAGRTGPKGWTRARRQGGAAAP